MEWRKSFPTPNLLEPIWRRIDFIFSVVIVELHLRK